MKLASIKPGNYAPGQRITTNCGHTLTITERSFTGRNLHAKDAAGRRYMVLVTGAAPIVGIPATEATTEN